MDSYKLSTKVRFPTILIAIWISLRLANFPPSLGVSNFKRGSHVIRPPPGLWANLKFPQGTQNCFSPGTESFSVPPGIETVSFPINAANYSEGLKTM